MFQSFGIFQDVELKYVEDFCFHERDQTITSFTHQQLHLQCFLYLIKLHQCWFLLKFVYRSIMLCIQSALPQKYKPLTFFMRIMVYTSKTGLVKRTWNEILWTSFAHLSKIYSPPLIWTVFYNQVDLLKNKLGFDGAFNYKEESDLNETLKRLGFNTFVIEKFWVKLSIQ